MSGTMKKLTKNAGTDGPRIVLPGGPHQEVFRFHNTNPPRCVVEVPMCRYNGVSICLAADDGSDMDRLKYLSHRFKRLWDEVADKMGTQITI